MSNSEKKKCYFFSELGGLLMPNTGSDKNLLFFLETWGSFDTKQLKKVLFVSELGGPLMPNS